MDQQIVEHAHSETPHGNKNTSTGLVQHLPSVYEALGSNPSTTKSMSRFLTCYNTDESTDKILSAGIQTQFYLHETMQQEITKLW